MDKAELMKDEIAEQRKLPQDIIDKLNNETFINFLISIALMIYLMAINVVYLNEDTAFFTTSVKVFAMVLVCVDVAVFEFAYRKESIPLWISAFELLACGVLVLVIPYIYIYMDVKVKAILMLSPIFLSIYYLGKTIVMHIVATKKYQNNLSDVKEIVKDEEEGYLDEADKETEKDEEEETEIKNLASEVYDLNKQIQEEKELIKQAKQNQKEKEKKEKKND